MSKLDSYDCGIHRGAGAVARFSNGVVVTPGADNDFNSIQSLYGAMSSESTGESILAAVNSHIDQLVTVAAVIETDSGVVVVRKGDMTISIAGSETLFGAGSSTETLTNFEAGSRIEIYSSLASSPTPVAPYNLKTGVSPGAGISMTPVEGAAAMPADSEQPSNVGEILDSPAEEVEVPTSTHSGPEDNQDFYNVVLSDLDAAALPPLAELDAPSQANDSAGFIIFDDGTTFGLNRSYAIGRNPESSNELEALKLSTANETISRNHANLVVAGGQVSVTDLGSTNGTFIWNATAQTWSQIESGSPVLIEPGTTVALGRRAFVYEGIGGDPRNYSEPHEMPIKG